MDIQLLRYLVNDAEERIDELTPNDQAQQAALGVGRQLIGDGGQLGNLTQNQRYTYESYLRPLMEDVPCDGMLGDQESCTGNGVIDQEDLLLCYQQDEMRCQICRYDAEKWDE